LAANVDLLKSIFKGEKALKSSSSVFRIFIEELPDNYSIGLIRGLICAEK
jgi:hypothetical protein